MNLKTLAKLFALSGAAMCLGAVQGLADAEHCRHVGGGALTNFLPKADCASSPLGLCTDGPATGAFQRCRRGCRPRDQWERLEQPSSLGLRGGRYELLQGCRSYTSVDQHLWTVRRGLPQR